MTAYDGPHEPRELGTLWGRSPHGSLGPWGLWDHGSPGNHGNHAIPGTLGPWDHGTRGPHGIRGPHGPWGPSPCTPARPALTKLTSLTRSGPQDPKPFTRPTHQVYTQGLTHDSPLTHHSAIQQLTSGFTVVSRSQTPRLRRREAKRNAKDTQLCCALDNFFGGMYVKIVKIVKK